MKTHWTADSIENFAFRIALDFIAQLDKKMESETPPISQVALAKKLRVSKSRVSQVFNDPENIELKTIVKYSKALNMKVTIVAYEDNDPENIKGPVDPEIFNFCWEKLGKPRDFWAFEQKSGQLIQSHATVTIANAVKEFIPRNDIRIQGVDMTKPTIIQRGMERATPSTMANAA